MLHEFLWNHYVVTCEIGETWSDLRGGCQSPRRLIMLLVPAWVQVSLWRLQAIRRYGGSLMGTGVHALLGGGAGGHILLLGHQGLCLRGLRYGRFRHIPINRGLNDVISMLIRILACVPLCD